jgi:hypothetical protein
MDSRKRSEAYSAGNQLAQNKGRQQQQQKRERDTAGWGRLALIKPGLRARGDAGMLVLVVDWMVSVCFSCFICVCWISCGSMVKNIDLMFEPNGEIEHTQAFKTELPKDPTNKQTAVNDVVHHPKERSNNNQK